MTLHRDPRRDLVEQLNELTNAVIVALKNCPSEGNPWLNHFPNGSCELAAWVLGSLLFELGYGDWTMVNRKVDPDEGLSDRRVNHVWLELRDGGRTVFTVDPTAQQFDELADGPIVAEGAYPLRHIFSERWAENLVSQPQEWHLDKYHAVPLACVRRALLEA